MRTSGVALVQPYQSTIDTLGETGLVYLAGSFSHAFGKAAIFGVNDPRHNGLYMEENITARVATAAERALGDRGLQAFGQQVVMGVVTHGYLAFSLALLQADRCACLARSTDR